ncbi:MAG: hypothetical protein RL318_252 [Fibrobacterota bacterium]|jgi:hypothetical protein
MDFRWSPIGLGMRATLWTAFWILFDLLIRRIYPGHDNTTFVWGPYLLGVGLSWLTARLILEFLGRIASLRTRLIVAAPVCLLWTCFLVGSGYLYRFFGEYITGTGLLFVLSEPPYLLDYLATFTTPLSVAGFLSGNLVMGLLLIPRSMPRGQRLRTIPLVMMCLAWIAGVWSLGGDSRALPPDASSLCAVRQAVKLGMKRVHLQAKVRALPSIKDAEEPWTRTIVVIVNESWGTTGAAFVDNTPDGLPLLRRRLEADSGWITFPKAFTNATATDVSVPSIFTGCRTDEGWDRLHAFPFPWDIARARGFRTAFVTSQRLKWQNMDGFFFPSGIDEKWSMENLGAPAANDAGVDDMVSARKAARIIQSTPSEKPLFLVWNSNSLHGPFQEKSEFVSTDSVKQPGRWFKALRILDVATDTLLSALEASGRLKNALVIMTGDHGEIESIRHRPMRIYNYYDEITRIPFVVHAPDHWNEGRKAALQALRTNRTRNVQNLDIAPTLAQVLGLKPDVRNDSLFKIWKGTPLVTPVDSLREIMTLSANDIHTSNREGFGLVQGNRRLVFTTLEGVRFFDVTKDSLQDHDLWPTMDPQEKRRWIARIEGERMTRNIWKSVQALTQSTEAKEKQQNKP